MTFSIRTALLSVAVAASAVLAGAGAAQATPATPTASTTAVTTTATPLADGFYREAYGSTIYQVTGGVHAAVDAQQYVAAGSPTPAPTPTDYVKYPWSSGIYAVTSWPDGQQWDELTAAEWTQAGSPTPHTTAWVPGSTVTRYDTSAEIFLTDPDGRVHQLTYGEWLGAGSPAPRQLAGQGFLRLSWSPEIFAITDLTTGAGHPLTAAAWTADGSPTPRVVPWIAGERWERDAGAPTIYYVGPGVREAVTAQQWAAAGRPTPRVVGGSTSVSLESGSPTASPSPSTYTNSDGVKVQSPVAAPAPPAGASAQCKDGTYSSSTHHSGTCSHHGGVAHWV